MSWLDRFFVGVTVVSVGGSALPQEAGLDLTAGPGLTITGADSPTIGRTLVVVSATGAPLVPQHHAAAGTITFGAPVQAITASTSGAGYNLLLGPALDGQEFVIDDRDGTWVAHGIGLTTSTGIDIENPVGAAIVTAGTVALPADATAARSSYRYGYLALAVPRPIWKLRA